MVYMFNTVLEIKSGVKKKIQCIISYSYKCMSKRVKKNSF